MVLTGIKIWKVCLSAVLVFFLLHCGGDKNDKDKNDTASQTPVDNTTTGGSSSTLTNLLATAFPGSLALSVFPQNTAASLRLTDASLNEDIKKTTLQEKVKGNEDIVNGRTDSCLPKALQREFSQESAETCYEFDQDMIYGTSRGVFNGTLDGKSTAGESCLVSFTRNQVAQIIAMVDQTLGFGMAAICQAKKDNETLPLPAIGETLDLKTPLAKIIGTKGQVTTATMERLADVGSKPVFRMFIKAAMGTGGVTRTIGVIHSPISTTDNSEYNGTVYMQMSGDIIGGGGMQPAGGTAKSRVMSIVYAKKIESGKSKIKAELRTAQVNDNLITNAISSTGVLDFNNGANFTVASNANDYGAYAGYTQANDAFSSMTYIVFDMDTESNEGTLAYWKNPGGNYYENARGFNIAIEKNASGVLSGCATSGAASTDFTQGISIRRFLKEGEAITLSPKGFWHPFHNTMATVPQEDDIGRYYTRQQDGKEIKWYAPKISDKTIADNFIRQANGSYITRQCFIQDSTSGLYLIDPAKIAETAGYEVLDTGNTVNSTKFIPLPNISADAKPVDGAMKKID